MSTVTETSLSLTVGGMTCGACAARVERKLNSLDGVEAIVNYATERARVRTTGDVAVEDLVQAVRSAGYSADAIDAESPTLAWDDDDAERQVRSLRRRLLVAVLLFIGAAILALVGKKAMTHADPTPKRAITEAQQTIATIKGQS